MKVAAVLALIPAAFAVINNEARHSLRLLGYTS